jgi:hypothetical protein
MQEKTTSYPLFLFSSEVVYSAEVPGPPTCLQLFYNDGGEKGDQVPVYNIGYMDNGHILF